MGSKVKEFSVKTYKAAKLGFCKELLSKSPQNVFVLPKSLHSLLFSVVYILLKVLRNNVLG